MSDPVTKAERSKAKDKRQEPAPDAPSNGPRKVKHKKGKWVILVDKFFIWDDYEFGRYRNAEIAKVNLKKARRKFPDKIFRLIYRDN